MQCPTVYFPLFYVFTESLRPHNGSRSSAQFCNDSLSRYTGSFVKDNGMMAAVWIPAHYINFWFVLLHLCMPIMNFFGVFLAHSVLISQLHSLSTLLVTLAPSWPSPFSHSAPMHTKQLPHGHALQGFFVLALPPRVCLG